MRSLLFSLLLLVSTTTYSQKNVGIVFEHGKSWAEIKQQAKKENKYIFVDGFTTWCGPCRLMAQNIFPQASAGSFFNQNFINVAVQFDVNTKDGPEVKQWYQDAKMLKHTYKVNSYPTFLFFNPGGELIHTVYGGSKTADEFIARAKPALNPATQFKTLKKQYDAGNRSPQFLLTLINATKQTNNTVFLPTVVNTYLSTQKNLLTNENMKLAVWGTQKSTDPGFAVIRNNSAQVDAVAGAGKSEGIIKTIAFDEIVLPQLKKGGKKVSHGGLMFSYDGENIQNPNWDAIENQLNKTYPAYADEILLTAKPTYYKWTNKWPQYANAVNAHIAASKGILSGDKLNSYAWDAYLFCNNTKTLEAALQWSADALKSGNEKYREWFMETHSNLLYKLGKKTEAIAEMQRVIDLTGDTNGGPFYYLNKMKAGQPTW